jgi:hypothetical protein
MLGPGLFICSGCEAHDSIWKKAVFGFSTAIQKVELLKGQPQGAIDV